ncbi:unnamed protein product [Rotaria sp. Silwood1]|nr:unnamed protein product [Rotaria sp. Silwood1]
MVPCLPPAAGATATKSNQWKRERKHERDQRAPESLHLVQLDQRRARAVRSGAGDVPEKPRRGRNPGQVGPQAWPGQIRLHGVHGRRHRRAQGPRHVRPQVPREGEQPSRRRRHRVANHFPGALRQGQADQVHPHRLRVRRRRPAVPAGLHEGPHLHRRLVGRAVRGGARPAPAPHLRAALPPETQARRRPRLRLQRRHQLCQGTRRCRSRHPGWQAQQAGAGVALRQEPRHRAQQAVRHAARRRLRRRRIPGHHEYQGAARPGR